MATAIRGQTLEHHLLSASFRAAAHVVWAGRADATVLLDGKRGLYYTLNEVGGRAWELLVAGEPVIEILHCLQDEYEVSAETLEADMAALLTGLLDAGLIERIAP